MCRVPLLAILLCLMLPEQASAAPTLDRVVIGSGGGTASAGAIRLDLTFGELAVGPTLNGGVVGNFGFWTTVRPAVVAVEPSTQVPLAYAMRQAPNPFTTQVTISYAIPQGGAVPVFLGIYDLSGRLLKTLIQARQGAGSYQVTWRGETDGGRPATTAVYFATLHAGPYKATHKIAMLR